jgi:hypothetical protein
MNTFLETLKVRAEEAAKNLAIAQQETQVAQARLQLAAQEHHAWSHAYATELGKEKKSNPTTEAPSPLASVAHHGSQRTERNKTEAVRGLLKQSPGGLTPSDIWSHLEPEMPNRTYVYSILKRLKDRGEAKERRGRYFLISESEAVQNQTTVQ